MRRALDRQRVEVSRRRPRGNHVRLAGRVARFRKLENRSARGGRTRRGGSAARRRHRDARLPHEFQERKHPREQLVARGRGEAVFQRLHGLFPNNLLVNLRPSGHEPAHLHGVARPPKLPGHEILGLHSRRELEHHLRRGLCSRSFAKRIQDARCSASRAFTSAPSSSNTHPNHPPRACAGAAGLARVDRRRRQPEGSTASPRHAARARGGRTCPG